MDRTAFVRAFVFFCYVSGASCLTLKSNGSAAPPMDEPQQVSSNNVPSSVLKQSRVDGKELFEQVKTNQTKECTTWYMASEYYWGCVEFVNYAQFLCHWNWKQTVSAKDYLDLDDIATCGTCTGLDHPMKKFGVDPYLDETVYYINKSHPFADTAMKFFGKPFEYDPELEICSTTGVQSPTAFEKSFLRVFMKCIKTKTIMHNMNPSESDALDALMECSEMAGDYKKKVQPPIDDKEDGGAVLLLNTTKVDDKAVGGAVLQNTTSSTNLIAKVDDKAVGGAVLLQNTTLSTNLTA